jgi:hypothetical protein
VVASQLLVMRIYTAFAVTADLRAGTSTGRWRTGGGGVGGCWPVAGDANNRTQHSQSKRTCAQEQAQAGGTRHLLDAINRK